MNEYISKDTDQSIYKIFSQIIFRKSITELSKLEFIRLNVFRSLITYIKYTH